MRKGLIRAGIAALTAAGFAFLSVAQAQQDVGPVAGVEHLPVVADGPTLSVMTYNVEGLPFPFARGRSAAAGQIAKRLAALRAQGQQPHVVVLQEAFGDAQRKIGIEAGYRYSASGPDAQLKSDEAMTDTDRAFAGKAHFFKGEGIGKWRGSGLIILSDFPIVAVRKAAFPAWACAGFDCLANKGVLMAEVQVPGVDRPVAVIATHLNSKNASGVSKARWNAAFDRQAQTIGRFLAANLAADLPYVFAGDTNVGKSQQRRDWLAAALPRADHAALKLSLAYCLDKATPCAIDAPAQAAQSYSRGKDWQAFVDGKTVHLEPLAINVPFGADARGRMLSDHIGYTTLYRLAGKAARS